MEISRNEKQKIYRSTDAVTKQLATAFPQVGAGVWTEAVARMICNTIYAHNIFADLEDEGLYDGIPASRELHEDLV